MRLNAVAAAVLCAFGLSDQRDPHDRRYILLHDDEDPIDKISRAMRDARPSPQPAPRYPWQRQKIEHYETPKPLTKRQKRRARGRG